MILFAVSRDYPDPTPSLEALLQALHSLGAAADHRIWTETPIETFAAADLEPHLYFELVPGSAERLARALVRRLT